MILIYVHLFIRVTFTLLRNIYFLSWSLIFSFNFLIIQGVIIFHEVIGNEHDVGGIQIKVEGVYIWPFRQLRMVANR